jgi:hypothetical protein
MTLVEIVLIGSLVLLGLGFLFRYHQRRIERSNLLTEAEKDIVLKQTRALFGLQITGGVLVIGLLWIVVSGMMSPALIPVFIGVWSFFGVGCLAVFSYVGTSAIRNRVAMYGTGPVKGRRAVIVGSIYLITVVLGLVFIPVAVYTVWINQAIFQMAFR